MKSEPNEMTRIEHFITEPLKLVFEYCFINKKISFLRAMMKEMQFDENR